MTSDVQLLLGASVFHALDIDAAGRILAGTDETGSMQLIEISAAGAAAPLTALPGPCTGQYVPGERAVIVSHDDGGNERHQLSVLRLPPAGPPTRPAGPDDLAPLVTDPRFIHELAAVAPGRICYLTNRRNGVAFDPVIHDLGTGAEQTVSLGERSFSAAALSPDGRWLALAASSPVTANSEQVLLVDLAGHSGAPDAPGDHRVTEVTPDGEPAMNGRLGWLPDSSALIVTSNRGREFTAIARYALADRRWEWLISDDTADLAGWPAPDGSQILVERNSGGASALALHDAVSGRRLREMPLPGPGTIGGLRLPPPRWSARSGTVAFTLAAAGQPGDVLVADATTGSVTQATRSADGLHGAPTSSPERHRVPAPDGEQVPCLVYRPTADSDSELSGSAVLLVHGGPESQARQDYNGYVQALAAAGHIVVVPNVRGSTGYGKRWYSLDDRERRLDSVADLAAIHAWLPAVGADPARAALWGASYGGYMVLAGLAFQPELWAAGVDIVGISSLVTFLENTSAYRRAYREREYGTLARDRELLLAASPLTRIDQVRAPLFIIHGANDPRVPLSEAEQIHAALTSRGRECELLVYPDEGHGLARRANKLDAAPKAIAFLARHLSRA